MWDTLQVLEARGRHPVGTLATVASRDERRHGRHTADGIEELKRERVRKYLGRFQRELLMHLAISEARVMLHGSADDRRRAKSRGLTWKPARAVHPHVDYSPSLGNRISAALRALEEFGYVRTFGHPKERRRTQFVKVTARGLREAVDTASRWGRSRRAWLRSPAVTEYLDALRGSMPDPADEQAVTAAVRRAKRYLASPVARRDDHEQERRRLKDRMLHGTATDADRAALEWLEIASSLLGHDRGPWKHLEDYGDTMHWLRTDAATSTVPFLRGHADDSLLFETFREK